MKQSTMATGINSNNLYFEAGDIKLNVPECAMSDGFKNSMGVVVGLSIGVTAIVYCFKLFDILEQQTAPRYTRYIQQQPMYVQPINPAGYIQQQPIAPNYNYYYQQ